MVAAGTPFPPPPRLIHRGRSRPCPTRCPCTPCLSSKPPTHPQTRTSSLACSPSRCSNRRARRGSMSAPAGSSRRSATMPARSAASRISFVSTHSLRKEGLALMILAEALLRVPDSETADALIEDKIGQGDWAHHRTKSDALLVSASAWALGITARVIQPGETPDGILASLAKRIGLPAVQDRDPPGDESAGVALRPGPDDRRGFEARGSGRGEGVALLLRHARRGRPHGRGRRALLFELCRRDRGDRACGRQRGAAGAAGHLRQTVGAASPLRGAEPRRG